MLNVSSCEFVLRVGGPCPAVLHEAPLRAAKQPFTDWWARRE